MPRRVVQFSTGQPIPEGATYLATLKQIQEERVVLGSDKRYSTWEPCWIAWHYFLIEEANDA